MAGERCADCGGSHATGLCATQSGKPPPPVPSLEDFGAKSYGHKSLEVGERLNTFRLQRLLGRGSTADVFLAENEVTQAIAAVKVLRPELHDQPDLVRRFETEARTTNLVRHEHIVEIFDIGIFEGWQHYILLEHLDGKTVAKLLEREVDPAIATRIVLQLCAGLGAAHAKGVVHRDLKPANIFVIQKGGQPHAKLVDFGMARREALQAGESRTQIGSILGTALYMSPEQTLGQPVDGRADIYALGVVMYELATGRLPFEGDGPIAVMRAHLKEPPTPPRQHRASIGAAYEEVILRCLEKEPGRRWQSMAELGRAIVGAMQGKTPPVAKVAPPQPKRPSSPNLGKPVAASQHATDKHDAYAAPTIRAPVQTQLAGPVTLTKLGGVRREARVPTSFGVQLFSETGEPLGDALITDVSLSGAFVRTTMVLPLFSRIRLVGTSSAGPIEVIGEVVRLELTDTRTSGVGVRFADLGVDQRRVLEALQQKLLHPPKGKLDGDAQAEAVLEQFEARAEKGHYELLGVPRDSTTRRIRDVCERLAEEMSPKRFPNLIADQLGRFEILRAKLTLAEEELIDPARRALYDAIHGNVLGVLRCITEGLDLNELDTLRARFLKAVPQAEERTREPLAVAAHAER
ncbi:MAG: protein kinase, partial [Myxococcaceae bacterium]|nr:protein kinase [Myxococcaceae bacterium]